MSFLSLLNGRGTVMRKQGAVTVDAHGRDTRPFTSVATDVPCRRYSTRAVEVVDARGTRRTTTTAIDFLLGTDVTAADRLVLDGVTWELLGVVNVHGHHLAATADVQHG